MVFWLCFITQSLSHKRKSGKLLSSKESEWEKDSLILQPLNILFLRNKHKVSSWISISQHRYIKSNLSTRMAVGTPWAELGEKCSVPAYSLKSNQTIKKKNKNKHWGKETGESDRERPRRVTADLGQKRERNPICKCWSHLVISLSQENEGDKISKQIWISVLK